MAAKSDSIDSLKMPNDNFSAFTDKKIIFSLAYLPPIEYFVLFNKAHEVIIEQHEFYQKQSYRNRCVIGTANGPMPLTIPVEKSGKEKISDVRISDHSHWQTLHWRSIEAAYNSSPFFEYYSDDFRIFYEKKWVYLWDFNFELLQKVLEILEIEKKISFTDEYFSENGQYFDAREIFHPKRENFIQTSEYYQVFRQKNGFQSGLSILDLIFNMGNESQLIIR